MLEVKNLSVNRGIIQVIHNISMKADEGRVIALIGPNGAGKSTLLQTIAGINHPSSGNILFNGNDITQLSAHRRVEMGISYVPEDRKLFPNLRVYENLKLGAYASSAREKVKDTLEYVFNVFPILKERKNQLAGTLSGGEQKMLAIARSLMSRPNILLLDEPSQGLSPLMLKKVGEVLKEIQEVGVTTLLAEQNVHFALQNSAFSYVIESGAITLAGESCSLEKNSYIKEAYLGL